jgi:SOS-response transcriptional repressor LexA
MVGLQARGCGPRELVQGGDFRFSKPLPIRARDAVGPAPLLGGSRTCSGDSADRAGAAGVDDDLRVGPHGQHGYLTYPIRVNPSGSFSTRPNGSFPAMTERHDRLRKARIAADFATQAEAIRRHGWNANTYKSNENGNASFSFEQARAYAKAFRVRPEWLYSGTGPMREQGEVPIIGRVGADPTGRVARLVGQAANDSAPMPTGGTSSSVALEVDGHSMRGFADDGALVYFENQQTPPSEDLIGEIVVVQVAGDGDDVDDEDILIKRLQRGREDGLYDLESIVGPPLRDVRIRWAAEITQIIPPRQARRLIRRGIA